MSLYNLSRSAAMQKRETCLVPTNAKLESRQNWVRELVAMPRIRPALDDRRRSRPPAFAIVRCRDFTHAHEIALGRLGPHEFESLFEEWIQGLLLARQLGGEAVKPFQI